MLVGFVSPIFGFSIYFVLSPLWRIVLLLLVVAFTKQLELVLGYCYSIN